MLEYTKVESSVRPAELDKTLMDKYNVVFLRRNIKESEREDQEGKTYKYYSYEEAKLTKDEYANYLWSKSITNTILDQEDTEAYYEFNEKMNTPVEYTNGLTYKPVWYSLYNEIMEQYKTPLELLSMAGVDITQYLAIKTSVYDTTHTEENMREMTIVEIVQLYFFLFKKKEQYFAEFQKAKSLEPDSIE